MNGGCGSAESGFIEVHGREFRLAGRPIALHGVNSYPLLQLVGRGRAEAVADIFDQALALGRPFVRTNAFLDGGDNPGRLRDEALRLCEAGFAALDGLIAQAAGRGVRLLLVLTNNWPDHGGAEFVMRSVAPAEHLPKDAFWSDPRALRAQSQFIAALVGRRNSLTGVLYREDPAILGWELANEAQCVDPHTRDFSTLVAWARRMAGEVRAAGAAQPVFWGGSGYRRQFGEDLLAIARDGAVDVLTMHVYPRLAPQWASALSEDARIATAVLLGAIRIYDAATIARRHAMPLIVEELGYIPPPHARDRDGERAEVLRRLLALASEQGLYGFPWMIGEHGRPDYDGHLIRRSDTASLDAIRARVQ
jgi:mannan endo-1,4-beta-mannosidase